MARWRSAAFACLGLASAAAARAHLGPPYPILVDQPIPGYAVTVLANPDVGQAVAIVVLEPVKGEAAIPVANVTVWDQPVSGRLRKAVFPTDPDSGRAPRRFLAQPAIDAPEPWKLGVDIRLADGSVHSLVAVVQATPPGIGPWGLALFSFPIVLFGGLFLAVLIRRTKRRSPGPGAPAPARANGGAP